MFFSTKDQDNDPSEKRHCAEVENGGWWYKDCCESNPTGKYLFGKVTEKKSGRGMMWKSWRGDKYSVAKVTIMIRRHDADVHVKH